MRPINNRKWILSTGLIFPFLLCSCSGLYRYRGLSPEVVNFEKKEGVRINHHYRWEIAGHGTNSLAIGLKRQKMLIVFSTNAGEEQFLSVGPTIVLLPLPIIPWPPGIIKALTKRPPEEVISSKLEIFVTIHSAVTNPEFEMDFSTAEIETDPPIGTLKHEWHVYKSISQSKSDYRLVTGPEKISPSISTFRLTLSPIPKEICSISIKLDAIEMPDGKIALPTVKFFKGTGLGMNPGVVND